MAITVLSDVILPTSLLTSGVRGKQMRNNTRSEASNGSAIVNINWSKTLRQYELGCVPMTVAQWQTLEGLHEVTEGGAYGFLLPDPKDSTVASGVGLLQGYNSGLVGTPGFGYGVPSYKLMKRYSVAGSTRTKDRQITRPQTTPVMLRAGSGIVLSGSTTFTLTTGTLTFGSDYSTGVTSYTVGASTILNFGSGTMAGLLAVSGRIYLSGVSGTGATALNGLSHLITAITGNNITISTSTNGLTAAGGTAYKFPQPTETLTWTGSFYVPVHFQDDVIDWDMAAGGSLDNRLLAGPSVNLMEVRE